MNIIDKWLKEKGSNVIAKFVEQEALDLLISEVNRLERENIKLKLYCSSLQLVRYIGKETVGLKPLKEYKAFDDDGQYFLIRDSDNDVVWVNKKDFKIIT